MIPERFNKEIVVLETDEGTATSPDQLIEVWKWRLAQVASHYRIKSATVKPGDGAVIE